MWPTINLIAGCVAFSLMSVVLWKIRWHMLPITPEGKFRRFSTMTPADWMRLGVGLFHLKGAWRIGFWDVYRLIFGADDRINWVAQANTGFCVVAILGSICVLVAMRDPHA